MYTPDQWQLVKINGTHPHYRVFGSWSGGYLDGDSWRLNSGVVRVEEDDKYYRFYGHTGSCYECHKEAYGIRSLYNAGVLSDYVDRSRGTMELLDDMPDVMNMDWLVTQEEYNRSLQFGE